MDLLLTDAERDRFASWLEHEADISEAMIEQMEKIRAPEVLIKKERSEALAARLIAAKLRSIESQTITA